MSDQQSIQLAPGMEHLAQFEQVSTRYDAKIPIGVKLDDILKPEFWAHHSVRLTPFDEIRARAIDGSWMAYLVVLDCARTWARVHVLQVVNFTPIELSEQEVQAFIDAHQVVHRGPHKWSVVRKSDSGVLHEGMASKADANTWLEKHAREQVGVPKAIAA